jgi:hypothetical protein
MTKITRSARFSKSSILVASTVGICFIYLLFQFGVIGKLISPLTNRVWDPEVTQKICNRPIDPHSIGELTGETYRFTDQGCSLTYLDTYTTQVIYTNNLTSSNFAENGVVHYNIENVKEGATGPLLSLFHWGRLAKIGFLNIACCSQYVYDMGLKSAEYSKVSELQLSPNGRDLAYVGANFEGGRSHVVINRQSGTLYDIAVGIHFASDGRSLRYYACDDTSCYKVVRKARR